MKKIRNYNPDLGITLNDLRMMIVLDESDDYGCNLIFDVIDAVRQSVEENTTFTFSYTPKQIVYDTIMEKVEPAVEEYEKQLIDKGYTKEDIYQYHRSMAERNNKENE